MNNFEKRLLLFAAIEPGDQFWSDEISRIGASEVFDRIISGKFYLKISSLSRISDEIKISDPKRLLAEINSFGADFVTPEDNDWPKQLDDLMAPPIGLIIRGQREVLPLLNNSVAIVGTRNPTTYGIRVAGELAASACDHEFALS